MSEVILLFYFSFLQLAQLMKDVKNGVFLTLVNDVFKEAQNNLSFGSEWNVNVTVESVPEEASSD